VRPYETGVTILEVRMAQDFKMAHVLWTTAMGGDSRDAEHALKKNATSLRNMAGKMLRSKHTPRLEFVNDQLKSQTELDLDAAFLRAEEENEEMEEDLKYFAEIDAEVAAAKAAGTYVPGKYDAYLDDDDEEKKEKEEDEDEVKLGHAYEMYDGGEYYDPEFDDDDDDDEEEEEDDDYDDEDDYEEEDDLRRGGGSDEEEEEKGLEEGLEAGELGGVRRGGVSDEWVAEVGLYKLFPVDP
jgi:ribosome-binding factor A